jgi:hypothetical protein
LLLVRLLAKRFETFRSTFQVRGQNRALARPGSHLRTQRGELRLLLAPSVQTLLVFRVERGNQLSLRLNRL